MKFGKLKEVDIRELWEHEQYDFSSWLAKEENIQLLNEELGLTLIDIREEVLVGAYKCDLVAKDETQPEIKVVIENQLEATNHDHLGKIITYASGLNANVIVWIVKEAREEHRSAIEWLNNNISEEISFFLIEIHAYKIGDSLPAPMFKVIEKPNDFSKGSKISSNNGELTRTKQECLSFWTQFNDVIIERNKPFNTRKPSTDHWYNVAIGSSKAKISITLVNSQNRIGIALEIDNNKDLFDKLFEQKDEIHEKLGFDMHWDRMDGKKVSRIKIYIKGLNYDNQENYPELMNEIIDYVIKMRDVFKKYIK